MSITATPANKGKRSLARTNGKGRQTDRELHFALSTRRIRIVGIGASAGGLEAFTELLRHLPTDAGVAYVLVQHLDPTHRSLLSELLGRVTTLPVTEIQPDSNVEPDKIYVIPPNCNLAVENGILRLSPRKKNGGPARSIDHFLKSLAEDQKEDALAVILSGAGSDGAQGLRAVKAAGGLTFALDERSAKYNSMPRSAVATGCVDFVLPPDKIAEEIARFIRHPEATKGRATANARRRIPGNGEAAARWAQRLTTNTSWPAPPADTNLRKIFLQLRAKTGTDFAFYKLSTIRRRLARRMAANKIKTLEGYSRFLREHPAEIDVLYQDLLINVTSFFRNPNSFEVVKRKIFPRLVRNHSGSDALRVWVAGCSTGQEAYSLAMAPTTCALRCARWRDTRARCWPNVETRSTPNAAATWNELRAARSD
jgi:two-component system CheB/CheR fusion protein